MTVRFRLGEFNNDNNVVSAPIDLDRLKSKQVLNDCFFLLVLLLVVIVLLCFFSFSKCLFHFQIFYVIFLFFLSWFHCMRPIPYVISSTVSLSQELNEPVLSFRKSSVFS